MSKRTVNLWLNGVAFAAFVSLMVSGTVLHWVLPPGRGRRLGVDQLLFGWGRHDWRELHLWIALTFLALVVVHLTLHWSWIRANLLPRRDPAAAPGPGRSATSHGRQQAGLEAMTDGRPTPFHKEK